MSTASTAVGILAVVSCILWCACKSNDFAVLHSNNLQQIVFTENQGIRRRHLNSSRLAATPTSPIESTHLEIQSRQLAPDAKQATPGKVVLGFQVNGTRGFLGPGWQTTAFSSNGRQRVVIHDYTLIPSLSVTYPAGSHSYPGAGGLQFDSRPLPGATKMKVSYSVFVPDTFDYVRGGKLPGLFGGKSKAPRCLAVMIKFTIGSLTLLSLTFRSFRR
jgi:hypothetical protein